MTVIAYRDGIMAADGGTWSDSILCATDTRKIVRLDGRLVACCGQRPDIEAFVIWLRSGAPSRDKPLLNAAKDGDFGAIVADADGVWLADHSLRLYRAAGDYHVEGAHDGFLRGALAAGATAEQAVRLAVRHCAYAAGNVQVESL